MPGTVQHVEEHSTTSQPCAAQSGNGSKSPPTTPITRHPTADASVASKSGPAARLPLEPWRDLYQSLSVIYARRSNIATSTQVHILGWLIGVGEVWFALAWMGHPVSIGDALVIESLIQAVRAGAFMIPSAIGAQEAGLILLCGIFGVPPDEALALSLIKRAADVIVGVPGLIALQIMESGRVAANART